jgi:hypothetical protein
MRYEYDYRTGRYESAEPPEPNYDAGVEHSCPMAPGDAIARVYTGLTCYVRYGGYGRSDRDRLLSDAMEMVRAIDARPTDSDDVSEWYYTHECATDLYAALWWATMDCGSDSWRDRDVNRLHNALDYSPGREEHPESDDSEQRAEERYLYLQAVKVLLGKRVR